MNIVLVTVTYPPEIRAISLMMQELARELAGAGHRVTVVTSWPSMHVAEGVRPASLPAASEEMGVKCIRVRNLPGYKRSFIIRGISQLLMPGLFTRAIRKQVKERIDWVIVYSPPLPLALVGKKLKRLCGCRFMLNIQDIFPQNAVDLGILKAGALIRYFEKMEAQAYAAGDVLTAHTESSVRFLIERKGVAASKIHFIPNWIDTESFVAHEGAPDYRAAYGLQNAFVFLFSGVMGPSQDLDFILDLAKKVRDRPAIRFLFVGDGSEKKRLIARASEENIANVIFKPYVDTRTYPGLVNSAADVGLIVLSMKNRTPVVPGKILGFMAAGKPVLAFLHKESDAHGLIRSAGCGLSATSADVAAAAALVKQMYEQKSKLADWGNGGRAYVRQHFGKAAVLKSLVKLLE